MRRKHEELNSPSLFYCFVDFGRHDAAVACTYVVPASVVADALKTTHAAWLGQLGKHGQQRNDNDMRRFLPSYGHLGPAAAAYASGWLAQYLEAWHLLNRATP